MSVVRSELAESLAESTGWDVTSDPRRFTFINDDPPQVVVWTVSDAELGQLRYNAGATAKSAGGHRSAGMDMLCMHVHEAIGPFEGTRGEIRGTDLGTIVE